MYMFFKSIVVVLLTCLAAGCGVSGTPGAEKDDLDWHEKESTNPLLLEAKEYAAEIGSAAVLVMKGNEVVFSYGDIRRKYMCHSIRKPFIGALYGIHIAGGEIDIEATLEDLDIDDIPPSLTTMERRAAVRDLLSARSGVYHPAAGEIQAMKDARPPRGSHAPGTFYYYNNWDFNALGTIFTQLTGKGVFEAFAAEIAEPIGMQDFSVGDCTYKYEKELSEHPSYFFRMSTRDMARFGLLYKNDGAWNGRRIVPKDWIRKSTSVVSEKGIHGDPYGYLWCVIPEAAGLGRGFYHTGLSVHLLAVLADLDLVVVHRVDTDTYFDITWSGIRRLLEMVVAGIE